MNKAQRSKMVEKHMNRCTHFNGIMQETCKAGVNYRQLAGVEMGMVKLLPCFVDEWHNDTRMCDKLEVPTRAEAEQYVDEVEARSKVMMMCLTKAHEDAESKGLKKGHGGLGEMPCPTECGGTLQYSVASYNGHMHARCTTPKCVSWME